MFFERVLRRGSVRGDAHRPLAGHPVLGIAHLRLDQVPAARPLPTARGELANVRGQPLKSVVARFQSAGVGAPAFPQVFKLISIYAPGEHHVGVDFFRGAHLVEGAVLDDVQIFQWREAVPVPPRLDAAEEVDHVPARLLWSRRTLGVG